MVEDGVAVNVDTLVAKDDWDAEGVKYDAVGDTLNDALAVTLSELVAEEDIDGDGE